MVSVGGIGKEDSYVANNKYFIVSLLEGNSDDSNELRTHGILIDNPRVSSSLIQING